jgi:hypothetical protein
MHTGVVVVVLPSNVLIDTVSEQLKLLGLGCAVFTGTVLKGLDDCVARVVADPTDILISVPAQLAPCIA